MLLLALSTNTQRRRPWRIRGAADRGDELRGASCIAALQFVCVRARQNYNDYGIWTTVSLNNRDKHLTLHTIRLLI